MLLSALLERQAERVHSEDDALDREAEALSVLSAALQAVPTALWRSAHAVPQPISRAERRFSNNTKSQLLHARHALVHGALAADTGHGRGRLLGVVFPTTARGGGSGRGRLIGAAMIGEPAKCGILESPHVPWLRLVRCVECLAQLLRIDAVVPCTKTVSISSGDACEGGWSTSLSSSDDDDGGS